MEYDISYAWSKELFEDKINGSPYITSGELASGTWLYEFDESVLEEAERLNVILPLIKWCAENDMMTENVKGELQWYHRAYLSGFLDEILDEEEKEEVISDLLKAYHIVFGSDSSN